MTFIDKVGLQEERWKEERPSETLGRKELGRTCESTSTVARPWT